MKLPTVILLAIPMLIFALGANHSSAQQDSSAQAAKPTRAKMAPAVMARSLCTHIQPVYPQEAKDKNVQGTVRLHIVIGTDGKIKQANAISGDPLLTQAAIDAVMQWTYRPTLLNGRAIEVDSEVAVIFKLSKGEPR